MRDAKANAARATSPMIPGARMRFVIPYTDERTDSICSLPPNALRFCCAAVYPNLTDPMIGGELGGWGGVSSKRGLGSTVQGQTVQRRAEGRPHCATWAQRRQV